MNVCAIDIGKGGGLAWIEQGLLGKEFKVAKMPDSVKGIQELIKSIPCDIFVLEDVQIRPSDMEDGKIYRVVNVMIKNLHYLEASITLSDKKFFRLHPKRWTQPYKNLTKGMQYSDRKRKLKEIAVSKFPKVNVTLWNCDALLMMNHIFLEIRMRSEWLVDKENEINAKVFF